MYGVKCFPLREFCKNQINRNPKIQCLVNTVVESELVNQDVTILFQSSKKNVVFLYPDEKLCGHSFGQNILYVFY